jgi:hypothetical protein
MYASLKNSTKSRHRRAKPFGSVIQQCGSNRGKPDGLSKLWRAYNPKAPSRQRALRKKRNEASHAPRFSTIHARGSFIPRYF